MTILFEAEGDTLFAVAYNVIVGDYEHQELLIGEIDPALGGFMVRFEDSYHDPIHCGTLEEAKNTILRDHYKHTPRSMGRNYYIR